MYVVLVSTTIVQAVIKKGILMSHCLTTLWSVALCASFWLQTLTPSKSRGLILKGMKKEGDSCLSPTNLQIYMNSYPESVTVLQ